MEKYSGGWESCWYPLLGRSGFPFLGERDPKWPDDERSRSRRSWVSRAQSRGSWNTNMASIFSGGGLRLGVYEVGLRLGLESGRA